MIVDVACSLTYPTSSGNNRECSKARVIALAALLSLANGLVAHRNRKKRLQTHPYLYHRALKPILEIHCIDLIMILLYSNYQTWYD